MLLSGLLLELPVPEAGLPAASGAVDIRVKGRIVEALSGASGLRFEPNMGQIAPEVKFLGRAPGYTLFLTAQGMVVRPEPRRRGDHREEYPSAEQAGPEGIRMEWVGGRMDVEVIGLEELPGKTHYLIGNDAAAWRTHVKGYGKVRYKEVYPQIDLIFHSSGGELEYDFVVAPGGDPSRIRLAIDGVGEVSDEQGDLALRSGSEEFRLLRPRIYQECGEGKRKIANPIQSTLAEGSIDLFISKLNPPATALLFSTLLGGPDHDGVGRIAVDSAANIYGVAEGNGPGFPLKNAVQPTFGGGTTDAVIFKVFSHPEDPPQSGGVGQARG